MRNVPWFQAGFDYANAVLELRGLKSPYGVLTYERMAEIMGYEDKSSIARILGGVQPAHPQGEALYILYVETLHRKPPAKVAFFQRHEEVAVTLSPA